MKKLNYVQSKLLKKVDLLNFKNETFERESLIVAKYRLKDQNEYRRYNKLVGRITSLVAELRKLPAACPTKIETTSALLDKLYRLGVIKSTQSLDLCVKLPVSAFCRRRVTEVLKRLRFAEHSEHAENIVLQGHIRCGKDIIRETDVLITREMEDNLTWAEGSKYKRAIKEFRGEADDYDL